jgi:ATP-binding cassette subfamily A (ABC1) protein 3
LSSPATCVLSLLHLVPTPISSQFGIGSPIPVFDLASRFDGSLSLYWADATTANSSTTTFATPSDIMARVTAGFAPAQLRAVHQAQSADAIPALCPQNFNLFSECFAAVVFNELDVGAPVNYTIRADGGLFHIDVASHASDYEQRILPLQWAVDRVRISPVCVQHKAERIYAGDRRAPDGPDATDAA